MAWCIPWTVAKGPKHPVDSFFVWGLASSVDKLYGTWSGAVCRLKSRP